jgi:DNA-binding MarR family transcriptional regulator
VSWRADDYLPYLLARAAHEVAGGFHAGLRRHDLTAFSWRVLATLSDGRGCTVGELCERCLAKQPTVSKLIDRLERERWVRRRRDREDGRRVLVEITDAGRRKIAPVLAEARDYERAILGADGASELERLRAQLRALIARYRRIGPGSPVERRVSGGSTRRPRAAGAPTR